MGTKYYEDYRDFVDLELSLNEIEHITNAQLNQIIDRAVTRFSVDVPQRKTLRVTGNGGHRYALPSDWEADFSRILLIEYPDRQQEIPQIRIINYEIYDNGDGNGERIHLRDLSPGSTDTFTVSYVIPHTVTETSSTINDADFDAVGYLATSLSCLTLAGRMIRNRNSRQSLDAVNFRTTADEYRSLAIVYMGKYREFMGLPEKGPKAANFNADLDIEPPWILGGYLTHGRR